MTNENVCITCRRPKAIYTCDLCDEPICKDCEEFIGEGAFSYMVNVPEDLKHTRFCQPCYDTQIAPTREKYDETMARAREVYFFFKSQKAQLPVLKRARESVRVVACADRDETILRLAFHAASQDHNAIIDGDVTSEKVRNEAYQTSRWKGVGTPATVDVEKLERRSLKPHEKS